MIFQREALGYVIFNIRIPKAQGEEIGNAIFIKKNDEAYLLTAEHVVKRITPQSYVLLSDHNGFPTKVRLDLIMGGATFSYHIQAEFAKAKIIVNDANSNFYRNGVLHTFK
jgi:hypothetical protein